MVHPFVLQVKFRIAAERLLSLPDEELVKALFSEQLVSGKGKKRDDRGEERREREDRGWIDLDSLINSLPYLVLC